jgi:cobalamin biosynthesis protein CobW
VRIPILVVSGFLGSGKTTLVRHLLDDARRTGFRLAVVSNEFGELGIDAALLAQGSDDYVELEGGCVCCKLSDELVVTLEELRERARPDRIVVETSGVALPYDVQLNFWRPPICDWVGDDVAVVVVDADRLARGEQTRGTFEQQVSSADLLILNKLDLVEPARVPELEHTLREIEPEAPIIRVVRGEVDPVLLFPPDPDGRRERRREQAQTRPHDHESFETEELAIESGSTPDDVIDRVRALGALRAKGFVHTSEGVRLVQGVGPRIELSVPDAPPPERLIGRVVIICRAPAR